MIYSFLDKEVAEKLNVTADATFTKEYGNKFVFSLDENNLVISEEEDNYGDKSIVNADHIQLKPGDKIIARSMDGLTVISLLKMGVKVALLQFEVVELPIDKQTSAKKAELVYSLVSLD
jgi:hypothetical protein